MNSNLNEEKTITPLLSAKLKKRENARLRKQRQIKRDKELKPFYPERYQKLVDEQNAKQVKQQKKIQDREEKTRLKKIQKQRRKELNVEQKQWEKEIKAEEKRRHNINEAKKWKGSKKINDIRKKLINKLKKVHANKLKTQRYLRKPQPFLVSDALNEKTSRWVIDGNEIKDPQVFLDGTIVAVENLINNTNSVGKKVVTVLTCVLAKYDSDTGETEISVNYLRSNMHSIISEEDAAIAYKQMREKMLESLAEHQKNGSGWRLRSVEKLEIFITKYKPLNGKSYKPLPNFLEKKKAIINMKNDDDQCFKWAV